ncbi:MAG TPA: alpha/beta hydrolase [Planctomycetota bacterium]|nr:alpha/beta hydrolase [Planctomycetota bacterium]
MILGGTRELETRRGLKCRVREWGAGRPLVYLHGALGLLEQEPLLERLGEHFYVLAPEWPGYGAESTEDALEDMLDFALHGWDVVTALRLETPPVLIGHSMGGMIAAEMACLAPQSVEQLVLISSAGLWLDAHPLPDPFATLPVELAQLLFHDAGAGIKQLTGGLDFSDPKALEQFLVRNARRMGTAGKILFPIPNRRLSKRLYRLSTPTLLLWGREDRFVPSVYATRFAELIPGARLEWIDGAGHMVPLEQPEAAAESILRFTGR